jgi:GNAT superfamily N-acetyltransferase
VEVRRATIHDARGIAEAHVAAWQVAYRGILPDAVLDGLSVEGREATWRHQLATEERGSFTLVGVDDGGGVTGFCTGATPSRDEDATETTAEITATYVHPSRWRSGVGTALLDATRHELRERGYREVTLWVLTENAPARDFYARRGFQPDGGESHYQATGGQPILRLRRAT